MESGDSSSAAAAARPLRLVTFVSEEELDRAKRTRGERVEDGTAQRDRPLYEILKENKEKKDAEFNERFKHRPPKALDEDETEFLDKLEMSRREYERKQALEESEQLRSFQEAVATHASIVHEIKEPPTSRPKESKPTSKKSHKNTYPFSSLIVSIGPQAKKAKTGPSSNVNVIKSTDGHEKNPSPRPCSEALGSLVSYGDDSDDGDDS